MVILTGRAHASPSAAPSIEQPGGAWTAGAALSLVGMVVVSYVAMAIVLNSSPNLYGEGAKVGADESQRTTGVVAIVMLATLMVFAAVSAVKGGTGARVTAGFAITLGIAGVGWFGILTMSAHQTIVESTPAHPAAQEPTCGPDYQPTFLGPDDTFRACDADAEVALAAAQRVVATLTDVPPTVDALRRAMVDAGMEQPYVHVYGDTDVKGRWVAAPIACAVVTGDATGWHASATEVLMDGGCSDHPAGAPTSP